MKNPCVVNLMPVDAFSLYGETHVSERTVTSAVARATLEFRTTLEISLNRRTAHLEIPDEKFLDSFCSNQKATGLIKNGIKNLKR